MVSSERSYLVQIYQNIPYFNFEKYFFIYKNKLLGEKLNSGEKIRNSDN